MTPVPLELPLRPAEAAAVANLIFDQAEGKPLGEELRTRLAGRASVLRLTSLVPYFGSLERDPVHPSTYYLAVDGSAGEPLLLHMALANAPTGSLFPKPLLIGRMPRASGPEMVINCLPFGPVDRENLEKFAAKTDARLLPRPLGPRPALVVESEQPEVDFPVALDVFRALAKRGGKNLATLAGASRVDQGSVWAAGVWAAIRTGWREGYSTGATIVLDGNVERTQEAIRRSAACSRFTIVAEGAIGAAGTLEGLDWILEELMRPLDLGDAVCRIDAGEALRLAREFGPAMREVEAAHESIRRTRSALKAGRSFDFELSLESSPQPTSAAELRFCLHWMKARGHAVQLAAPNLGADAGLARLAELAPVARHYGCTLSVAGRAEHSGETLGAIGRATLGRVSYRLLTGQFPGGAADLPAAIQDSAAHLFA